MTSGFFLLVAEVGCFGSLRSRSEKRERDSKVVLFFSFHSLVYPVVVSTSGKVGRKQGKMET
jgi:hypothetical protein